MGRSGSGRPGSSSKSSMTQNDAARIQSASDRNSKSETARSGFASRAQSVADKGAQQGKK